MEPAGIFILVLFGGMLLYIVVSKVKDAKNKKNGAAEVSTEEKPEQ